MLFSNVPYWSLCYEMWYYVLYAIVAFAKGRMRVALLVLTVLLLGPEIMLLAPVWGLGVVLHRWQRLDHLPAWGYRTLFCGSIPAYLLLQNYQLSELGSQYLLALIGAAWHKWATYSRSFITDYLSGIDHRRQFRGVSWRGPLFFRPPDGLRTSDPVGRLVDVLALLAASAIAAVLWRVD